MLFQTTSISEIVSHRSASTPIQTGTEETRSILLPNWSFPGEALVCRTYWQDRFFLNKQGIRTGAPSGLRAGRPTGRQTLTGSIPVVSGLIEEKAERDIRF